MKFVAAIAFVLLMLGRSHAAGNLTDGSEADLIYDPLTGTVVLDGSDTPTQRFFSFILRDSIGRLDPDDVYPGFVCDADFLWTRFEIACIDLSAEGWHQITLNQILPKGLSVEELSEHFSLAYYAHGTSVISFESGDLDLILLTEPSPSAMLAITGLAFLVSTYRPHCDRTQWSPSKE